MILKSITPKNVGPFLGDSTLEIDPEVTVITGANDSGKSIALRVLAILCSDKSLQDHEVNRYRRREFTGNWSDDTEVETRATFLTTEKTFEMQPDVRRIMSGKANTEMEVVRKLNNSRGVITKVTSANGKIVEPQAAFVPPRLLVLPADEIRQQIELSKPLEAEKAFIRLAFGDGFSMAKYKDFSEYERELYIEEAQDVLSQSLSKIFSGDSPFRIKLTAFQANLEILGVTLIDRFSGFVPLGSRGAGIRRLINVLGAILTLDPDKGPIVVLYDEPEISLHADMQHVLRRLLEAIAVNPNVQVIYTTHSPAMINPMRPHAIRVVERSNSDRKAISRFVNKAFAENYRLVRGSLGISPADSLLFAPLTIIVEGSTEIVCLPLLLRKLADGGLIERMQLETLLAQSHFLDGQGDSFEFMCRLAKSQHAKPVLFVDGDKVKQIADFCRLHPDVPVVSLGINQELENLVPPERYIEAAATVVGQDPAEAYYASFQQWESKAALPKRILFSKKVDRWLQDSFETSLDKTRTMKKAIEAVEPDEIISEPFIDLVAHLEQAARGI